MRSLRTNRIWLATALVVLLTACEVFAGGRRGGYSYRGGRYAGSGWFGLGLFATALTVGAVVATLPREHEVVVVNGYPYYVSDNVYYQSYPNGYYVVAPPPTQTVYVQAPPVVQTVVLPAPATSQPVNVQAPPVAQPVAPPAPAAPQPAVVTATPATEKYSLYIPNSDGVTYTAVVVRKKDKGYVGPQGEFYPEFPKVEQLKAMYGK